MLVNFGLISRIVYYLSIELCKPSTDIAYKKDKPSTQIRKRQKLRFPCTKAMLSPSYTYAFQVRKRHFRKATNIFTERNGVLQANSRSESAIPADKDCWPGCRCSSQNPTVRCGRSTAQSRGELPPTR